MVKDKITIKKNIYLELRPAGLLCRESMKFKSSVIFTLDKQDYDAKRVNEYVGITINEGDSLTIACSGDDESKAFDRVKALFKNEL